MSNDTTPWTCDFCKYWHRVTSTHGITTPPCPDAPDLFPANRPHCDHFVNRFDVDPIARED
jgi:hypothetical protein